MFLGIAAAALAAPPSPNILPQKAPLAAVRSRGQALRLCAMVKDGTASCQQKCAEAFRVHSEAESAEFSGNREALIKVVHC